MDDAIANAINTYHELNASIVDELDEVPSPLEFMRHVARNRPFVVRRAAAGWAAVGNWDAAYLRDRLSGQKVNVAVTPHGNADAVVAQNNGPLLFVEPYEVSEDFAGFLDYLQEDSRSPASAKVRSNVKYAQTQNDNLREEYNSVFIDVPKEISFARIALQQEPDAINMWIGNERSTTALHKDNYENIYVQIRGEKHFLLLPPVEMPCTNEQSLPQAWYKPSREADEHATGDLVIIVSQDSEMLPVPTWDPDEPEIRQTTYSHLSRPLRVTLREGDMLYLPAMWYHKVSQTSGREGFACAVNYWYDMDFSGGFWTSNNFLRDITNASAKEDACPRSQINQNGLQMS